MGKKYMEEGEGEGGEEKEEYKGICLHQLRGTLHLGKGDAQRGQERTTGRGKLLPILWGRLQGRARII